MNTFVEWVSQPWPWYVAGPIIGLMVPLHLILLNRTFGVSSSFRHMCAAVVPSKLEFLNYDWKKEGWNLLFVVGILGGAWLAATVFSSDAPIALSDAAVARMNAFGLEDLSGQHPQELFSWDALSGWRTWLFILGGGFLVGFGTRYAGGCTSGHAIMGLSHFSLPSFVAVLGFFTGGLLMSWLILPLLLS
ncbi:MAG: YeeE/YedE family protein [Flavobacteriales bacterium]